MELVTLTEAQDIFTPGDQEELDSLIGEINEQIYKQYHPGQIFVYVGVDERPSIRVLFRLRHMCRNAGWELLYKELKQCLIGRELHDRMFILVGTSWVWFPGDGPEEQNSGEQDSEG